MTDIQIDMSLDETIGFDLEVSNPIGNIETLFVPIAGGGGSAEVDTSMSDSSTNPVQNKIIKSYVDNGDTTLLQTLNNRLAFNISGTLYPISAIAPATISGVSGLNVTVEHPTTHAETTYFFADGVGLNAVKSAIEAQIPSVDANPTSASNNAVSSGGMYTELQSYFKGDVETLNGYVYISNNRDSSDYYAVQPTEKVSVSGASVTQALAPDKFYVFGTVSSLTVTLTAPDESDNVHEYHFRFTSGSTATTLTLPNTVSMPSGFQVEASKTYEISIVDNYGTYVAW